MRKNNFKTERPYKGVVTFYNFLLSMRKRLENLAFYAFAPCRNRLCFDWFNLETLAPIG